MHIVILPFSFCPSLSWIYSQAYSGACYMYCSTKQARKGDLMVNNQLSWPMCGFIHCHSINRLYLLHRSCTPFSTRRYQSFLQVSNNQYLCRDVVADRKVCLLHYWGKQLAWVQKPGIWDHEERRIITELSCFFSHPVSTYLFDTVLCTLFRI